MKKINIAVDGFSSTGKSTIAKGLASKLNYKYIDSGAMYRAAGLFAKQNGWLDNNEINEDEIEKHINEIKIDFRKNSEGKQDTYLNDENVEHLIRSLEVADAASRISTLGFVRKALVKQQQEMGKEKGVIMDGRDIGTVVFPDAELKIFLTASPMVRATRRYEELKTKGENPVFEDVMNNLTERDERDSNRKESPLRKAEDAVELDNSDLSVDNQLQWAIQHFDKITQENG